MRKFILYISAIFLPVLSVFGQYRGNDVYNGLYDSEVAAAMKEHVAELSAASLEGRKAGSEGEKIASEYVAGMFRKYGVDLLSLKDGDMFGIRSEDGDTLTSRNIIGYVEGYDENLRDKYIVVGARLDNLGTMAMTVDGKQVERIFYGANGNASGLAMLVELARMVKTNSIMFRRSVLFVAFGASARTYAGAWYFLNRSFKDAANIDAMINLDMLGMGYNGFYAYTSSNADLNTLIRRQEGELQPILPELTAQEPYPSDHRAFYAKEIPSVVFTTGKYSQHNTDRDTQGLLDFETMERELEYIYNFTEALANLDSAPAFRPAQVDGNTQTGDKTVPYFDCDQRPQFFGSSDPRHFMREWVYQYLKYPQSAMQNGIQGTVMVQFVIDRDGSVTDVKVVKSVDEDLDAEALKVIQASPKWKAGKHGGHKVRASITLPVEFRLEKKNGKTSFGIKK